MLWSSSQQKISTNVQTRNTTIVPTTPNVSTWKALTRAVAGKVLLIFQRTSCIRGAYVRRSWSDATNAITTALVILEEANKCCANASNGMLERIATSIWKVSFTAGICLSMFGQSSGISSKLIVAFVWFLKYPPKIRCIWKSKAKQLPLFVFLLEIRNKQALIKSVCVRVSA